MTESLHTLEIITKPEWDSFIGNFPEANFLQSWQWGVFHQSLGKKALRYVVFRDQQAVALYQLVKEKAKRGNYLTCAGGPLFDWKDESLRTFVLNHIKNCARSEAVAFVRFRPQAQMTPELLSTLKENNCRLAPMHLTADLTLQLDLQQPDENILMQMRKNTRYEIKRVDKLGITTALSTNPDDIRLFYDIQCQVAKRHNFVPFSYEFLFEQFRTFSETDNVALISSYKENVLLASAFIIFYNGEAVYHYGVSTEQNNKLPGSYACQWRAIQEAKSRGCTRYNFWGIAPEDQPDHRFAGVSLFKRGFGGSEVEYLPAHDIPVTPLYWLTYGFEKLRKWKRKL